jgi:hypothetical protein
VAVPWLGGTAPGAHPVPRGALDPKRDLISDFQAAGFAYAPDRASLEAVPAGTRKLLGLFALSSVNVALDKLRAGVVGTYESAGFPRYPIAPDGYPATTDVDYRSSRSWRRSPAAGRTRVPRSGTEGRPPPLRSPPPRFSGGPDGIGFTCAS